MPSDVAIKCLLAAARQGNFTKAADELYMTRQAVSQQIASMEKELGVKLFERTTARVVPTPVGELYIHFFEELQQRWDEVQQKADAILKSRKEMIRIGCLYAADLENTVLNGIREDSIYDKDLEIIWERRELHELLKQLLDEKYDIVFAFKRALDDFPDKDKLEYFYFEKTHAMIAVRNTHPLVREKARAKDFINEPCYLAEGMQPNEQAKAEFVKDFAQYGLKFSDVRVVSNRDSVQTMVEYGRGITVCTDIEYFAHFPEIKTYPIHEDCFQELVCVWRHADWRPHIRSFLQQVCGNLENK